MTVVRAAQSRRHRERERLGLISLHIEVDEAALLATLRLAGFIGEHERDPERDGLAQLLEHVIALWVDPPP
jgi:hypothetical protein